jgi:adenosylcobinamide kinase/adenosylcobinamide-phosphate guanylyltransferase
LFDDITLYLSNLLYGKAALQGSTTEKAAQVARRLGALVDAARRTGRTVVFVSNDVGAGIVPDNAMAREYRDIAGWANQQLGQAADRVFYVLAGQAVDIKQLAFHFPDTGSPRRSRERNG